MSFCKDALYKLFMGVSIKKNYYHSESCAFDFKRLLNLVNLKHKKIHEALCRLMMGIHNQSTAEKNQLQSY